MRQMLRKIERLTFWPMTALYAWFFIALVILKRAEFVPDALVWLGFILGAPTILRGLLDPTRYD